MNKTYTTAQVARALMSDPDGRHWGTDIRKRSGVRTGTLYPILWRMLEAGWLEDDWEDRAQAVSRPPRRYYKITASGKVALAALAAS